MDDYNKLFINGKWVSPKLGKTFSLVDPCTEEEIGRVPEATEVCDGVLYIVELVTAECRNNSSNFLKIEYCKIYNENYYPR